MYFNEKLVQAHVNSRVETVLNTGNLEGINGSVLGSINDDF